MIYSATRQQLVNAGDNPHYYVERQAFFVVLGMVAMYVVSRIDYRRFDIAATPLYIVSLCRPGGRVCRGQHGTRGRAVVQHRRDSDSAE